MNGIVAGGPQHVGVGQSKAFVDKQPHAVTAVVDPAHLDEEANVPGVVSAAMREGRVLAGA